MSAAHRRRRIQQHASRRRRTDWHVWAWVGGLAVVLLVVMGMVVSSIWRLQQRVVDLPVVENSHQFMVNEEAEWQRLLLVGMTASGEVEQLAVLSYRSDPRSLGIIRLPNNVSGGEAIVADYLRAEYYGELQRMVERQIGLPLTGYILERYDEQSAGRWSSYLTGKKAIGWLNSTVGLPWWLSDLGSLQTNLSWSELLKLTWRVREGLVANSESGIDMPVEAVLAVGSRAVTLDATLSDSILRPVYNRANFSEEGVTVEVKNATNVSGLAALVGRYVANMGGEVVATVAADTPASNSALSSDQDSLLGQEFSAYFDIPLLVRQRTGRERSDMELVLGEDALVRIAGASAF